jgi:cytochrome c-type biogenesis protein CcmH
MIQTIAYKLRSTQIIAALLIIVGVLLIASALPTAAQESTVTDDQVNAIAHKLYCPVCENITLDVCGTAACEDWRYEVRLQLEQGRTEQEIIDDFVVRFGDRVVGTPQDPVLRALSLVAPWVLIGAGLIGAVGIIIRWQMTSAAREQVANPPAASAPASDDRYRDLLEQDLAG